jgi:hypothetical protein
MKKIHLVNTMFLSQPFFIELISVLHYLFISRLQDPANQIPYQSYPFLTASVIHTMKQHQFVHQKTDPAAE